MSAKRGIEQEWEAFRNVEEWQQGAGNDEQRLSHQLLLGQLLSKTELQGRDFLAPNVTVDMLVTRWTTVPRRDTIASSSQAPQLRNPAHESLGSSSQGHGVPPLPLDFNLRIRNDEEVEAFRLADGIRRRAAEPMPRIRKEQSVPALYRRQISA